jgi:Uncharacterized conserved protein
MLIVSSGGIMKYNKLVRDNIPELIKSEGREAVIERLDDNQYREFLNVKLGEELKEYLESEEVEELADLVEVIYAVLDYKNVSINEFEKIRMEKNQKRGAFKERLLLKEIIE